MGYADPFGWAPEGFARNLYHVIEISGQRTIPYPPERAWGLLRDASVLRECVPGCDFLEPLEPSRFRLAVRVGGGLLRGKFRGEVELKDLVEPVRLTIHWRARGLAGHVEGTTDVHLVPTDGLGGTEIRYRGEARARGLLRTLSAGILRSAARSFTDKFFEALSRREGGTS